MEFAISPPIEGDLCLVKVCVPLTLSAPEPALGGELRQPAVVACLNDVSVVTAMAGAATAPVRITNHTGKAVFRHDGTTGGGRHVSSTPVPVAVHNMVEMLTGALATAAELGGVEREVHLVFNGAGPAAALPSQLLTTQFATELKKVQIPDTIRVTAWIVGEPWSSANNTQLDVVCRKLQETVLGMYSWHDIDRTPQKKKTYHGLFDEGAELFYEGELLRSLATADSCPLELLLLLLHLPPNGIRIRRAPTTAYIGQLLFGLPSPPALPLSSEVGFTGVLQASPPLLLSPSGTVETCTATAQRTGSSGDFHHFRISGAAEFAFVASSSALANMGGQKLTCTTHGVTEKGWDELDGAPLARLQAASMGQLHLVNSVLHSGLTFEEAQPVLEHLWAVPSDLPSVTVHRTATALQDLVLKMRRELCQVFMARVGYHPAAPSPLKQPKLLGRQMSCLTPWSTQ